MKKQIDTDKCQRMCTEIVITGEEEKALPDYHCDILKERVHMLTQDKNRANKRATKYRKEYKKLEKLLNEFLDWSEGYDCYANFLGEMKDLEDGE